MRKRSTPLTPNPLRRKPRRRLRLFRNSRVCSADEVRGSRAQVLDPLLLFRAQFQMFLAQFQVSSFPSTVILSEAGRSRFAGSGSGVEGPVQNLFCHRGLRAFPRNSSGRAGGTDRAGMFRLGRAPSLNMTGVRLEASWKLETRN